MHRILMCGSLQKIILYAACIIGFNLIAFTPGANATPSNVDLFLLDRETVVGNVQWEVLNGNATIDITLSVDGFRLTAFSFNTNPTEQCGSCPILPPRPGTIIDDSVLFVTAVGLPTAVVVLDGTDDYDWSIFDIDETELSVAITGLPLDTTNDDIFVPNSLIRKVEKMSGEFGVGLTSPAQFNTRAYSQTIPEPTTLALFGIGLLGLGVMRRRAGRLNRA